jgi:hypothetical protein
MAKSLKILVLLLAGFGLTRFLSFSTESDNDDKSFKEKFNNDYAIYALPKPEAVSFAGEMIPLEDDQVYQQLDRELLVNTYWQSQTVLFLKRSAQYFPIIEPILKEEGIPEDFKYLPLIESGFMPVVSPAGAVGFWQIMESTGRERGLEISKEVDERYHLEKSTRVACAYLKEAHQKFGSWISAAASYNMGMSGLERQLERQSGENYFDLTLNSETARYVYRIAAVKLILESPEAFGFHVRTKDRYRYPEMGSLAIDSTISDFKYLLAAYDINYRTLKYYNPWLRLEYLPNPQNKTYWITLPREIIEAKASDTAVSDSSKVEK